MTTSFSYEHTFRADSVEALLRAFTDPSHVEAQDARGDVARRTVIERIDTDAEFRCDARVETRRELPAFVQKLVGGGLSYTERLRWNKRTPTLEIDIQPDVMNGRSRIQVACKIEPAGPGQVRRIYTGTARADVALIGGRIERSIVTEIGKSLDAAAAVTQAWLDARRAP